MVIHGKGLAELGQSRLPAYSTSVVLSTYNGSSYIQQQLSSIIQQSTIPDQIVVVDDSSSDDTAKLADATLKSSGIQYTIVQNDHNLGYTQSFGKAASLATCDIIFFCDQDDFWQKHKIRTVLKSIIATGNHVITHDAEVCDENLISLGHSRMTFYSSNPCIHIMGCCTAISSTFRDLAFPIPPGFVGHDNWISILGNLLDTRQLVPDVLLLYRRHPRNTSNPSLVPTKASRSLLSSVANLLSTKQSFRSCQIQSTLSSLSLFGRWYAYRFLYLRDFLPHDTRPFIVTMRTLYIRDLIRRSEPLSRPALFFKMLRHLSFVDFAKIVLLDVFCPSRVAL